MNYMQEEQCSAEKLLMSFMEVDLYFVRVQLIGYIDVG
jgi:hypothetical protein